MSDTHRQATTAAATPEIRLGFGFTVVPDAILDDTRVSLRSKMVYVILCRFAGKEAKAFPSLATIAERAGIARSSAQEAVKELQELGYLEKQSRTREGSAAKASNLYTLSYPIPPTGTGCTAHRYRGVPPSGKEGLLILKDNSLRTDGRPVDDANRIESAPPAAAEKSGPSVQEIVRDFNEERGTALKATSPVVAAAAEESDFREYLAFAWSKLPLEKRREGYLVQALKDRDFLEPFRKERTARMEREAKAEREAELARQFGLDDGSLEEIPDEDEEEAVPLELLLKEQIARGNPVARFLKAAGNY